MRKLKFPEGLDSFEAMKIGLPADRQLSDEEANTFEGLFQKYKAAHGRTDLIAEDVEFNKSPRAEELRKAYGKTKTKGSLSYIRTRLIKLAANRCPCCGGSRPSQLDHHLPKDTFAEYSLWLMNLVPYCVGCNQKKSNHPGASEDKAFLHPYFDAIPDTPYIKASVTVHAESIEVVLAFDDNAVIADEMIKTRMRNQFEKVDVNARIEDEITEFITEHCDTIDDEYDMPSPADIKDYLIRNAARFARRHGNGSWRSSVLLSLAINEAFCAGGYKIMLQEV